MRKIVSLFQRNYEGDRQVRDEVVPGAEWVAADEGKPTEKHDGTACMMRGGVLYKRYGANHGKTPPEGWEPCEPSQDPRTGHWPGWLRVTEAKEDKWFRSASTDGLADGTYELVGPKVQGNPYQLADHEFRRHGSVRVDAPRTFSALKAFLAAHPIEGIVWHHPDGRMVKIKSRDFGLRWPPARTETK